MTNVPGADDCKFCKRKLPRQWIPPVPVAGRPLAGTGVWQSQVENGRCFDCLAALESERRRAQDAVIRRVKLIKLLGGEKPYREFLLERFEIAAGNRVAHEHCRNFNPATENLYLWGFSGVGKTHLAYAVARRHFDKKLWVTISPAYKLSRLARMKDPEIEQATINKWIATKILVIDDLGACLDTANGRHILQEILDGRDLQDRAGLIVTRAHSLDLLAQRMGNKAIASRLAGMCKVVRIQGPDFRLSRRAGTVP